jgi:hypothetical protein
VTITITDGRPDLAASVGTRSRGRRARGTPLWVIQVYVVLLILIPPTQIFEPLGAAGTPATLIGLVALVHWAVAVLLPDVRLARTVVPVRIVVGLLAATVLLRYAILNVGYVPVDQLLSGDRILLGILSWAGVALLAAEGLENRAEVNRVVRTFVLIVAAMAVVGFLQFRAGIDLASFPRRIPLLHENGDLDAIQNRSGFRRPAGTAGHPIEFGAVIAMALPLALHVARFDATRTRFRRSLPVGLIAIGIPVAVSRSAILGAAVAGFVVFLGLDPRLRPKALMAVAGFVTLVYATTPGLLGTLRSFFLSTGQDGRVNDYGRALAHIRKAPWFGHGPGTFIADSRLNNAFDNILDNQYLGTLIEVGLIGLAVVLAYLLGAAFLGRGARHRSTDPATRDLGQALAAASVAGAVTSYTFDAFSCKMFAGVVPLCLGLAGALWALTREDPSGDADRPPAALTRMRAVAVDPPATIRFAPAEVVPDDRGEIIAAQAGEFDLLAVTAVIDLTDATLPLPDPEAQEPVCLVEPLHEAGPAGTHDLRRVAVAIGSGAAIILLVALPFFVESSDDGQPTPGGIATVPGLGPGNVSSTTLRSTSSKVQPPGPSRAVATTAPEASTTVPGGTVVAPTATTAPPTATTATTATPASTTTTASPETTTTTTTESTTTTTGTP